MAKKPVHWFDRLFKLEPVYVFDQNLAHLNVMGVDNLQISKLHIRKELLRQAHWSFNFAILLMAASSVISIIGISLLLSGKVTEGTVTTAGGLVSYILPTNCLRLVDKANDRLNRILRERKQEEQ